MQALAQLWGRGAKDFAAAQQGMWFDMAERMAKAQEGGPAAAHANVFDPQGLSKAGEAFAKLWSSAIELSQAVTRNMQQAENPDPLVTEMLGKVFDPRAWFAGTGGMDEALQRMAEGPRLADLWDTERKMLDVFNAWAALRRRSLEHNTVMLEAWMQAAGAFAKTLNEKADRKETLGSWREVLALWVETANTALLETQRSEAYLESQREILKASTELRLAQQEVAAFYSEMFGYPSRAELDDVHRTVTELRRELRALQRGRSAAVAEKPRRRPRQPKPAGPNKGTRS
jgi:class III poly(R)-hydroxyalkanoic acid synthase PhaE subunit